MRQLMRQLKGRRLPIAAKLTAAIALSAVITVSGVTLLSLHRKRQVYQEELESQATLVLNRVSRLATAPWRRDRGAARRTTADAESFGH